MGVPHLARLQRLLPTAGRLLAAAPAVALMPIVPLLARDAVRSYALHLCRWPARLSCEHGTSIWWLVPIGLALGAAVGAAALAEWARTGRRAGRAWAVPAWVLGFPLAVAVTRPVLLDWATLLMFAGYAGLGIELTRRLLTGAVPRRLLNAAVAAAWVSYAAIVAAVPDLLADAAAAEGLASRP